MMVPNAPEPNFVRRFMEKLGFGNKKGTTSHKSRIGSKVKHKRKGKYTLGRNYRTTPSRQRLKRTGAI